MRTIIIAGAHSSLGKTILGRKLEAQLGGRIELVKVGHGREKGKEELLLHSTEAAVRLIADRRRHGSLDYLIIESSTILRSFTPDFCIFIEGCRQQQGGQAVKEPLPKKSAQYARERADLIISDDSDLSQLWELLSFSRVFEDSDIPALCSLIESFCKARGDYL
jgi:hypothetical protein